MGIAMTIASGTDLRVRPTLAQVQAKWTNDLQLVGLQILADAARGIRHADYIACMLDTIRDSYAPREATYIVEFVLHHAALRGLLGT
jgi:hypothetical protein